MTGNGAGTLLLHACLFLFTCTSLPGQVARDTASLAQHLRVVRGQKSIPTAQFKQIQSELVGWADARLKKNRDAQQMNAELAAAGLFAPEIRYSPDDVDIYHSFAGYLSEVGIVQLANGLTLIRLGIGLTCGYDETEVVYQRAPLLQLGRLDNSEPEGGAPWVFEAVDVSAADSAGRRILAAGAHTVWCTSRFVGVKLRIEQIAVATMQTLLNRQVSGSHSKEGDIVDADVTSDTITFEYVEPDDQTFTRNTIEVYIVKDGKATRVR